MYPTVTIILTHTLTLSRNTHTKPTENHRIPQPQCLIERQRMREASIDPAGRETGNREDIDRLAQMRLVECEQLLQHVTILVERLAVTDTEQAAHELVHECLETGKCDRLVIEQQPHEHSAQRIHPLRILQIRMVQQPGVQDARQFLLAAIRHDELVIRMTARQIHGDLRCGLILEQSPLHLCVPDRRSRRVDPQQ